ncbi:multiple resistance and pH regulation protein F [Haloterrigena turkmenica DSM 5511]|uniref:Multiple resistance and pH regulation protein F n=1 Tax=Haloterrigena turkmenica (strain ATCC 51198 / DSM 5511 / JCM 9101 / NCIMB 13204 / VKM B-1734 / 4k) TaxID=543526 RepID=D2RWT7_HALTV|nr:monovalent cation/H+ antiporter complex subunit F [Haloterrigena turkmenica]ADB61588.1 multiple resistance and pH regulation protein F [Haloterrigena turkmenica DSM 5511]
MSEAADPALLDAVVGGALILVSGLCVLCSYRVISGPTNPDRVVALDAIATNVVAIAVLFAIQTDRGLFVTVSLVLAIIGFIATVAAAKFITDGEVIDEP